MYAVCDNTLWISAWYFITYMFLVSILFAQLFVGFIIERFSDIQQHVNMDVAYQDCPYHKKSIESRVRVVLQDIDGVDDEDDDKVENYIQRLNKLDDSTHDVLNLWRQRLQTGQALRQLAF